jgi:hypothetical protein
VKACPNNDSLIFGRKLRPGEGLDEWHLPTGYSKTDKQAEMHPYSESVTNMRCHESSSTDELCAHALFSNIKIDYQRIQCQYPHSYSKILAFPNPFSVRFEVLKAVKISLLFFRFVTPCRLVGKNEHFE